MRLADFVMPFFDFMAGVSIAITHTHTHSRTHTYLHTCIIYMRQHTLTSAVAVYALCRDGVRLADFVMPFFDFMVGVSIAIAFRRFDLDASGAQRRQVRSNVIRFRSCGVHS